MELNSALGRADGVSEAELEALSRYETAPQFSERARAALAYGEALAKENTIPPDLFERVRRSFSEDEVVELTATVTWEICAAKFNRALEIEGQGICVLPNFGTKDAEGG